MKPLPLKIDNFLLEKLQEEAKQNGITKAEVIRSALVYYLTSIEEDRRDITLIRSRLREPDVPESRVTARFAHRRSKTPKTH